MDARPVLVTGATGLVGGRLLPALARRGARVRALSRDPAGAARRLGDGVEALGWDGTLVPEGALRGAGAVVHLAGEPIFGGLPSAARRRRIHASRVLSTRSLVEALGRLAEAERPRVLVCASAVGWYGGDHGDRELDETAAPGTGFLAVMCRDWEEAAARAESHGVRVVRLRIGVALAREGGALGLMLRPFRLGLGGRIGSGHQWLPWVHVDDVVGLILLGLEAGAASGPINAVAPGSVRNADFARLLAAKLGRPAFLPLPAFVLRAALGEIAGELLDSRRVVPRRARELGYGFAHATLEAALEAELGVV
jgi:uncharacterized protein (TIGR01777 family)